jgi:hypothetical protein
MLSVLSRAVGAGRGASRRELLRAGGLSLLGLSAGGLARLRALAAEEAPELAAGRQRSCIFIFLLGGPSHIDLWDMKPEAPREVRGEFQPVATCVPGIDICEHLPQLARQMDKLCLVRSMTHRMNVHGPACSEMFTGRPYPLPPITDQARPEDWPSLSALATRFDPRGGGLPPAVVLPWYVQFVGQGVRIAGQTGGRMGEQLNPLLLRADLQTAHFETQEFLLADELSPARLADRRRLLFSLEESARASLGPAVEVEQYGRNQSTAYDLLADHRLAVALDVQREPGPTRAAYGPSTFGQSLLVARRLVEAGVSLVTVNWYDDTFPSPTAPHWDTHYDNFATLKDKLLPVFDPVFSAFIADMHERGLLDSTLVAAVGEFGRTPRMGQFTQAAATNKTGRDHWPWAFTALLAGGGIAGGQVYGATDRLGGYVLEKPVTPGDLAATVLRQLGIDPHQQYWDHFQQQLQPLCEGRPMAIAS